MFSLLYWIDDQMTTVHDCFIYKPPIATSQDSFLFLFLSRPVQQKKKTMHDKLMDGDNNRFVYCAAAFKGSVVAYIL